MNFTLASPPPTPLPSGSFAANPPPRCANCGADTPKTGPNSAEAALAKAQSQIADLDSQIRQLNEKATSAIYRCAAYEEELARLRSATHSPTPTGPPSTGSSPLHSPRASRASPPGSGSFLGPSQRLSSLLSPRKSSPNLRADGGGESAEELAAALAKERALRAKAEETVRRTGEEAEELSAALFERANEMVAGERRERAALEERVRELEEREKGRARRLEVLEGAVDRMERVRALLEEERVREEERAKARRELIREGRREENARLLGEPLSPGRPTSKQIMLLGSPPLKRETDL